MRTFSGMGGAKYQEEERYKEEKIKLIYTDFTYPEYPQLWKGFEKNLTVLDILFNCGYEKSAEIIKGAGKMRYALIGCGRISTNHVKAVLNNQLEFVAACDIIQEQITELLKKHGLENISEIKALYRL